MVKKAFQYRIYPNTKQRDKIAQQLGCCRFVYNWALNKKIEAYQTEQKTLSCFELTKQLTQLKKQEEYSWLKDVDSQALQMSLRNLDNAFTKFFREKAGFPKFKSKRYPVQSCQYPQRVKVDFDHQTVYLPKIGNVKTKLHRMFEGKVKTVTLRRTATGKYFISILVETSDNIPEKPEITFDTTIGVDLGIKDFAILSTGEKYENPKYLKKSLDKLKRLQQLVSRKQKGSQNRKKAVKRLAKQHEKVRNQRKDFLHRITYRLTHNNTIESIALETLNVNGMIKNHCLAQAISDVSWSQFNDFLEYKAEWYGKNILRIGRFEPSSKLCSVCGFVNHELTLSIRSWMCPRCKTEHDRDQNAAINIKQFALQPQTLIGMVQPESTPGE
jgi:putative transposase